MFLDKTVCALHPCPKGQGFTAFFGNCPDFPRLCPLIKGTDERITVFGFANFDPSPTFYPAGDVGIVVCKGLSHGKDFAIGYDCLKLEHTLL
jgi:hypothetical protein